MRILNLFRKRPSPSPGLYVPVTIADIIKGKPSKPIIKHTHVEIKGRVVEVLHEQDGDHHVWVSDGINKIACEIIPELPLRLPNSGSNILIDGILRYDYEHSWFEVHPICRWKGI